MRVLLHLLLLGMLMTAAIGDARAQPAAAKAKAREYVEQGLAAQNAGNYDAALALYTKAYELVPHPVLLFDMAQAHRLAGHVDLALALYENYLAQEPGGAQAQTAHELVAELKTRELLTAEPARREPVPVRTSLGRSEPNNGPVGPNHGRAAPNDGRLGANRGPIGLNDGPAAPGSTWRLAGMACGGAGMVSFAFAIGYGVHAQTLADRVSRRFDPDTYSKGKTANRIAITGWIGGSALVAAGAAMYWFGITQDRRADALTLAPMASDQHAGLVIAGSF